jgi:hypothetical protein
MPHGLRLLFLLTLLTAGIPARAQTNIEVFGQNRVQYRKFDWKFFDTEHFRVYHYDAAGRSLARYVAEQAESDITAVEKKLGGQFPRRLAIIVYNNYDEYRQTNVGRKWDSQLQDIPAGTVNIVGDRLVVHHTGVHTDLRRQLRAGMSRAVMERMVFGESIREIVKNAVLLNLPQWTVDGFVAYLVDGWDSPADGDWKNVLAAQPDAGFYTLAEQKPELAGKAFWKWIAESRGETEVKNLLYTMQLRSSLNQGIRQTLGMKVKDAYDSCIAYYKRVYAQDALMQDSLAVAPILALQVPKDRRVIKQVRTSPRGADVAYVSWQEGEWQVYIQKTAGAEQRSLVVAGGRKDYNETAPDPDYPLLAWSNNGYKMAVLYKKGQQTRLRIYSSLKARIENYVIPSNRFDRVTGFTFAEDDDKLILSAIKKSQTDLYEFRVRGSRLTPITNDPWDDTQPWFVSGGSRRGIIFLSNRPTPNLNVPAAVNQLPTGPMNVFFYDTKVGRPELLQCSYVTKGTVSQPIQYGPDNLAYLYDSSGVRNRYVVVFGRDRFNEDSAYAVPVTNLRQNILSHQYNPASNTVATVIQQGDQVEVHLDSLRIPGQNAEVAPIQPTTLSQTGQQLRSALGAAVQASTDAGVVPPVKVTQGRPRYQTDFPEDNAVGAVDTMTAGASAQDSAAQIAATSVPRDGLSQQAADSAARANSDFEARNPKLLNPVITDSTYLKLKAQPYRLSFKPDFFSARVDNSVLFQRYQSARFSGGQFMNAPLGGMITVSLNDVLENHRFTGGIRLPVNFSGLAYFLQYENFKSRIDWGGLFLRTETFQNYDVTYSDPSGRPVFINPQLGKVSMNLLQGSAHRAFDRIRRLNAHLGVRQDVLDFKSRDTLSLSFSPRESQWWGLSRLEYVFDNSSAPSMNLRQGYRYKFYAEYLQGFNNGGQGMYNAGLDFRHYQKVYRNVIFASRIAGAHSGGKQKIRYLMGGVDNWILPRQAGGPGNFSDNEYAFQALATNMRGYEQSARIGNTFAVANLELRVPVLHTVLKRPVQSPILRNLQLVGFLDAGSAWQGLLPSADRQVETYQLFDPARSIILNLEIPYDYGLAMGYGAGLRTMLFGYFVRTDFAWNIEGRRKPILYVSIGTDF